MTAITPSVVLKDTAGEEIVGDYGYIIDDILEVNDIINNVHTHSLDFHADCVKHIRDNFDVNIQLDKYIQLYKEIV